MKGKESFVDLLVKILAEIDKPHDIQEEKYPFPNILFLGNGEAITVTPRINRMFVSLSAGLMDTWFRSHMAEFTDSEWDKMVRRAFGTSLSGYCEKMSREENAEAILTIVKKTIDGWINDIQEREYVFGCHISNISELKPISIGPVLFEPRLEWLTRVYGEGKISKISHSRLTRVWQGKRLRKRKPSMQAAEEQHILDSVGNGEFVCSVTVGPMGPEAGLQKALIAARIATTAISLGWNKPSSALNSITLIFDREARLQEYAVFSPDGQVGWGSSRSFRPGGVTGLTAEQWEELRSNFSDTFNCAGEAIRYVTLGPNKKMTSTVAQQLFQALLWFHEGCRETSDVMAIVKYCSSMEALANGNGYKGIINLTKAHVKPIDEDKLHKDVKKLYGAGRSQTVHGTNDKLGHDWSNFRNLAEALSRLILIACLHRAAKHPHSDDPQFFARLTP